MDCALYVSACKGDIEPIKVIERLNVIVTPNNNTILHVNIAFGLPPSTEFVKQVLVMCSQLHIQFNDDGDTPLHVAAKEGLVDIVEVLIKHAKTQMGDLESNVTAVKQMLRMTNKDGNTALHEVAQNHDSVEVVKLLMEEDHDFLCDSVNNNGETALYIAASRGSSKVVAEMLGTYRSVTYNHKGPCGMTILHAAVRRNHLNITRRILYRIYREKKRNPNERSLTKEMDENGWIPLHYAAYYGHHLIVKLLVAFDASDACIADRQRKMTALHLAAGQGHYDIIDTIIVSCPACVEQVDNRGWNYVHFSMCNVTYLLGLRRYNWPYYLLRAKDVSGNTPLLVLASISQYSFDLIKMKCRREFIESTMHTIRNRGEQLHQLKDEVSELSRVCCEPYKYGVVCLRHKDFVELCSIFGKETEIYMVVAALVATVAFTAGLTLPGGYIQEDPHKGTAVLIKNSAFQAFVISDTVALLLSVLAIWLHILCRVQFLGRDTIWIIYAHMCTLGALVAMLIAFVTGTYAILSPSSGLAITTAMVGLSFLLLPAYFFCNTIFQRARGRISTTRHRLFHFVIQHLGLSISFGWYPSWDVV